MDMRFYFDVVCPYAYMASLQIEALAARTGATLIWRPILLGGVYRAIGRDQDAQAGQSPARARVGDLDLQRQAERHGLTLNRPEGHPRRTVEAMRLITAAPEHRRPALAHALFDAYWAQGRDVSDASLLREIAAAHDLDPGCTQDPAVKQALFDATDEAVAAGVFGVPAFVVGGDLFWGLDRLHLVEQALGGHTSWPDLPPNPLASPPSLTFFHDFSSPYSYLASTQIRRVAQRHGADLQLAPFLLGALFHAIGTEGIPMHTFNAPKLRWYEKDMRDFARFYGVPYRFPSTFPLHTVAALRVAIAKPDTTDHIYRAAWADDRNIGDPATLKAVLDDAGFDGALLLEQAQQPEVKNQLRLNTDRARDLGACGAPTFLVNGTSLFWGQDRLDQVQAALAGWQPATPLP